MWLGSDVKLACRLVRMSAENQRDPFDGIGEPEPLKGEPSGYWSPRIDDQHRLDCRAHDDEARIFQARRYHY